MKYYPVFGKFMWNKCKCNVAFAGFAVVLAVIIQIVGWTTMRQLKWLDNVLIVLFYVICVAVQRI